MSLMKNFNTAAIRQGFVIDDVSTIRQLRSVSKHYRYKSDCDLPISFLYCF